MALFLNHEKEWKCISWSHSNEKLHSLSSSVRSDGSLQVRLCLADESRGQMVKAPGGEREGMRGSDPCRCLNQCRCAGWSQLRCCMRTERRIESWCRTEVPWETVCVCGCDSIYLKLDSFSLYKCTGQWVVSFFTCREEQEIIRFCGPLHSCLYWFSFHCFCVYFWGDFAYACPIYSDPERESILVLSICKQLMISEFVAEAHGSPGGHVFTGCLYNGERSSGASSGFTWNK